MNEVVKTPQLDSDLTSRQTTVPIMLVVDDHADTRALLRYFLESYHYEVAEAADGEEAVKLAETIRPNLILMDTTLERMDGLEAMRRIRSSRNTRDIPIVFLSGHAQPNARAVALVSGANDYLVKPVSLKELEKVVERQLSSSNPM